MAVRNATIMGNYATANVAVQRYSHAPYKAAHLLFLLHNIKRAQLENWQLETYGVDLSLYLNGFLTPYIE